MLEVRHKDHVTDDPIAWVMVEREEVYSREQGDSVTQKASIRLRFRRIQSRYARCGRGSSSFDASYCNRTNTVSLTSAHHGSGAVNLDLPGLEGNRIGTYLMNEIVLWVKQWPNAAVNSIELLAGQAIGENKGRRNWFYEQFGLKFDWTDPERREVGCSLPMLVQQLNTVSKWQENIAERKVLDYVEELMHSVERISWELKSRVKFIQDINQEAARAEAKPFRWALRIFAQRHMTLMAGGAILMPLAAAVWFRFLA